MPVHDPAEYLRISLEYFKILKSGNIQRFFGEKKNFPPLFFFSPFLFYAFFEPSYKIAPLGNLIYLLILLLSIYGIGKKIYNEKFGLLSALAISTFPGIYWYTRLFYVDFALTSMIILSIYLFILSDCFKIRKYSVIFGICAGIAILIKIFSIFYLLPLMIFILPKTFKNKQIVTNAFLSIFVASLIVLPIFANFIEILNFHLKYYSTYLFEIYTEEGRQKIPQNYLQIPYTYYYYLLVITKRIHYFLPFFFLSIPLFIYWLFRRKKIINKEIILLLFLTVFIYLFFTFIPEKEPRVSMPLLPLIGILSMWAIYKSLEKIPRLKILISCLIVLVALLSFVTTYKEIGDIHQREGFKIKSIVEEILKIDATEILKKEQVNYGSLSPLMEHILKYLLIFNNKLYYVKPTCNNLLSLDYLIVGNDFRSLRWDEEKFERAKILQMFKNESHEIHHYFKLSKQFRINNSTIELYRNDKPISNKLNNTIC